MISWELSAFPYWTATAVVKLPPSYCVSWVSPGGDTRKGRTLLIEASTKHIVAFCFHSRGSGKVEAYTSRRRQ